MSSIVNRVRSKFHKWRYLKPEKLDVTFVVSSGRTGTKFFELFFDKVSPSYYSVHEPRPDFFDLSMNKLRNDWKIEEIVQYILKERRNELSKMIPFKKKKYVECNPFNTFLLDELKVCFPKAKFIVITREAKDYVKSALNKSPIGDSSKMMFYADNDGRKRVTANDFPNDPLSSEWNSLSRLEKICWYWSKSNSILLDFLYRNKEYVQHISFENIFQGDIGVKTNEIQKIEKFLNLKLTQSKINELLIITKNKKNSTEEVLVEGFDSWSDNEKLSFKKLTNEVTLRIENLEPK